jgi:uncharacterized protein
VSFVRRHRVLMFFLLAYALAWGAIPWWGFFGAGALAAAVVTAVVTEGRPGLRRIGARLVRWRVSWVWYAVALAVPLGIWMVAVLLNVALGAAAPPSASLTPWHGLPLALGLHLVGGFGGPLTEEAGFRGFAQPELQRHRSRLGATAIMALLVSGWHAPLWLMDPSPARPTGFITAIAVTFWYAWLFDRGGQSALLTLLAHAVEGGGWVRDLWAPGNDRDAVMLTHAVAWCLVALVLLLVDRRFWVQHPDPDPTTAAVTDLAGPVGSGRNPP